MRPTSMPTRRLDSGFCAAARIARPSLVCWNSSHSRPTTASSTAMMPSDSIDSATSPSCAAPLGKMDGKPRLVYPQIQPAAALSSTSRPRVTISRVSGRPPSTGRISTRSMAMPPRNDSANAPSSASHNGRPLSCSAQAMNVENIAISPWAKFTIPVERKISTRASASAA
jgi:hypothetical protein